MAEARVEVAASASSSVSVVGDVLTIAIDENATTGYRWDPVAVDPALERLDDELVLPDGAAIGAAGRRRLRFRIRGTGRVELVLRRSWTPEEIVDRLVVRVE
ncbi:protease inhibitor I42 family protein [Solirubrobacter soli]|uniref:protease inhibitor I42 family protein n=1 Tax=Solirubrobacter soli TaxID=363832 RepID=UPI0003F95593|nr:protease inhibitor I42 family protein [Solirubrobacter soli]